MTALFVLILICLTLCCVSGHGQLNLPPSRNLGNLERAGRCAHHDGTCDWMSELVHIPGEATLPLFARTYNVNVSSGGRDYTAKNPWRSPGRAPVRGRGCGMMGGGPTSVPFDGATAGGGHRQGLDGVELPPSSPPAVWRRGEDVEVAWGISTNHGGGYSYRLCNKNKNISEDCFQGNVLHFSGNVSWLQRGGNTTSRIEVPLLRVTEGTFPSGSEWARNPVPACDLCDIADCGPGGPINSSAWVKQQKCAQSCAGSFEFGLGTNASSCPMDLRGVPRTQFPEPRPGVSGYLWYENYYHGDPNSRKTLWGASFSIIDRVSIPAEIEPGDYLLSWRWDAEGTAQIWQNCADVTILDAVKDVVV